MTAVYDGPAAMRVDEVSHPVRVRLTGHIDPIDGKYHWRGTVFELGTVAKLPKEVAVTIGGRTAEGQLTEVTAQGTHGIAGVGAPPYPLDAGG
ncbi:DUF4873 domain-containing protein [Mycobacterium sp. ACS1612]|uniref:DUF4873 domain-containing protein n=1 Tax=Mycobacterium sp. ACS1612 TaxID=1834117 RepID=UPI001E340710|nr:DUF4873 domain-containing protein [Mycobacterium sp. ACS1612]